MVNQQIRILHVLSTAAHEGAGIAGIVNALATDLPSDRYIHEVVFRSPGPWQKIWEAEGIRTFYVPWRKGLAYPVTLKNLESLLIRRRYHIVHQHIGGKASLLLGRLMGMRTIAHVWSYNDENEGLNPKATNYRFAHQVIATSLYVQKQTRARRSCVIYPGIALPANPKNCEKTSPIVVGTAARLVPMKGIEYLIRAIAFLHEAFPSFILEIAGDGPLKSQLQELARTLGVSQRVRFLGWCQNMPALYERWSIYVQPSLGEPFGIAALEAMAYGLPLIVTTPGGIEELIGNSGASFLVEAGETSQLSQALAHLLSSPTLRHEMGIKARARAEHFSRESMIANIRRVYDEALR